MATAATTGGKKALHRRRIIERPRLIALLDESTAQVRTLVAPAGYGKTTLAEQWVEKEGRRGTWFTARPSSTDVAALALGLAGAATEIVPDCDARLREHLRALPAPAERVDVLAELLGEDLEGWPQDAWLVLDDYHELSATADAERLVEELVAVAPIQLLIASRQRPSWITARRILYGEVLELNQTELAMDGHEAAEVLSDRNSASASGLVALANGWPAVIGLASVSAAEIDDPTSVPESLYQFFAEEVFSALDQEVQAGLSTLAITAVIDRHLAGILLGNRAERICNAALDIGILVERGKRLEIHPLARAFLEARREHLGVAADMELVDRCVAYFSSRRDWDAASDLIVRYDRSSQLEPLLHSALEELLETARLSTIESWCDYGDRASAGAAIVALSRAEVALRGGRLAAAQAHAESASKAPELEFRALTIAGRAAHLQSREEEALELLRRAEARAPSDALRRSVLWDQVICMIDLEMPEAIAAVEELAAGVGQDDPLELLRAAGCRSMCQTRFGGLDLTEADRVFQLLAIVGDPMVETGFLSLYSNALGLSARYAEARAVADMFLSTATRFRLDFALPWAMSVWGIAAAGLRNWSEAERKLRQGISESRRASNLHAEQQCMAGLVRTLSQQGRYDAALAVTPIPSPVPDLTGPLRATRAELLASRALALAAIDRIEDAESTIHHIREHSRSSENTVLIAATDAIVALRRHDAGAIDQIRLLADVAFSTGAVDLLVCAYRSVPELLPVLFRSAPAVGDSLGELVRRAGDEDLALAAGVSVSVVDEPRSLLTGREREVYDLLRQGLTNREIAQALVITEGTAKLHVQHIFDKVGVRSRKAIAMQAMLERSGQATSAIDDTGGGTDS